MATLEKIMHMGEEIDIGGGGGFKEVTDTVYDKGKLISFVGDGKEYELQYKMGRLYKIITGGKTYKVNYGVFGRVETTEVEE